MTWAENGTSLSFLVPCSSMHRSFNIFPCYSTNSFLFSVHLALDSKGSDLERHAGWQSYLKTTTATRNAYVNESASTSLFTEHSKDTSSSRSLQGDDQSLPGSCPSLNHIHDPSSALSCTHQLPHRCDVWGYSIWWLYWVSTWQNLELLCRQMSGSDFIITDVGYLTARLN